VDDETTTADTCEHCAEELILTHDEMKGDEASCAACGRVYYDCGNCGSQVGEYEWKGDVGMCENCWEAILANNP